MDEFLTKANLKRNETESVSIGFRLANNIRPRDKILSSIQQGAFSNMKNLKKIQISFNEIQKLHATSFDGLVNLEELIFSYNQTKEIEMGAFIQLKRLKSLQIECSCLGPTILEPLESLNELSLCCSFENLNELIRPLKNLKALSIYKYNKDQFECFESMPNLETLTLNSNHQSGSVSLQNKPLFRNLINLKELSLIKIDLDFIEHDSIQLFQGLFGLKSLNMTQDCLKSKLKPNIFKGLFGLEKLDLCLNQISSIDDPEAFKDLANLKYLNLSYNELRTIHDMAFQNLSCLETLFLHQNKLEEINPNIFKNLKNLKSICL